MSQRKYYIDWVRVTVFYMLIFFHTGMMFVSWQWHISNSEHSETLKLFMAILSQWRLPALFVISGAAVYFVFSRRGVKEFLLERMKRLFIPLVFGVFVVVPPQVYFERISQGIEYSSLPAFYLHFFDGGVYPEGNFTWHHLWYIVYILFYSILFVPILNFLKKPERERFWIKFKNFFNKPGRIFLLPLPVMLSQAVLRPFFPDNYYNLYNDWGYLAYNGLTFLTGYFVAAGDLWKKLEDNRRIGLIGAIIYTILFIIIDLDIGFLFVILKPLNFWFWIVAIFGYARKYLNKPGKALKYLNESVYPFYILHQTVIIAIGYYIIQYPWAIWEKYLIVSFSSLAATVIIYEVLIRRINFMRLLFGLKPKSAVTSGYEPFVLSKYRKT